jgi:hypothetical protein
VYRLKRRKNRMVNLSGIGNVSPRDFTFNLGRPTPERSKKRKVRPMLGIPSPRDLPDFLMAMAYFCEAPRLWAKYYTEMFAYQNIRNYFLKHTDYTHLVICPDDLLITPGAFNLLRRDLEEEPKDYPVLAGICNAKYGDDRVACRDTLGGGFISNEQLDDLRREQGGDPIVRVRHEGFALSFIRRDIVEKVPFGSIYTTAIDHHFSLMCYKLKIPIHVDTRARLIHLCEQPPDGNFRFFKVGKEKPYMLFEE